ncbi:MAG: hypothetical protein K0R61_4125, partial [Microvirga sp.]|nr:hypothetical protein [Microvirga sp.]
MRMGKAGSASPVAGQVTDEIWPPSTRRIEPVMNEAFS